MTVEKFDQYEVLREVGALIDSLPPNERRQVMASLGERYSLKISDRTNNPGQLPGTGRKRSYS